MYTFPRKYRTFSHKDHSADRTERLLSLLVSFKSLSHCLGYGFLWFTVASASSDILHNVLFFTDHFQAF